MTDFCLEEGVMVQLDGQFDHRFEIQGCDFQEARRSYFMDANANILLYKQRWFLKFLLWAFSRVYSVANWLGNGGKAGIVTFPPIQQLKSSPTKYNAPQCKHL